MRTLPTVDGRYLAVEQDGDENFVVYRVRADGSLGEALWDRFSYERSQGMPEPAVSGPHQPEPPAPPPPPGPPRGGGGLVEHLSSRIVRARLSAADMRRFLPERGPFTFPAPYGTRGTRITNASDGGVRPNGMAYWPVINNSTGRPDLRVVVSIDDTLTLFSVDKASLQVQRIGALPFHTTGEFCYFSFSDPDLLYVPDGTRLFRYNVRSHQVEVAVDAPGPITQCHSSYDGTVHSMTLNDGPAVFRNGRLQPYRLTGGYDECQVDKSGEWLVSKEIGADRQTGNRVIHLDSGLEWFILKTAGGVGHSDTGWGYVIGEDNQTNPGGVFRLWLFTAGGPVDAGPMYSTDWTPMTRYVSHCNAIRSRPENHVALFSSSHRDDVPRANELVLARLNGSGECVVVCPNLTDLSVGPQDDDSVYWRKTRACIDPTGRYAAVSGNMGTDRIDLFVVELPGA